MENDKIHIISSATEKNGTHEFQTEISEKPQFMLDSEYNELLLLCVINAVEDVCKKISPEQSKRYGLYIANKIAEKL